MDTLRVSLAARDSTAHEEFWSGREGAVPLLEPLRERPDSVLVTLFYRGSGEEREVFLRSNAVRVLLPGNVEGRFQRIPRSDIWYLTMPAPSDLLTTYAIQHSGAAGDAQTIPDPLNPDTVWTSSGSRVSALALPDAPTEPWLAAAPTRPDSWLADTVAVAGTGIERDVWVRLPPTYDPRAPEPYPVVIALNRFNFRYAIPSDAIIDGLAAQGMIRPAILVVADELEPDARGYATSARWIADGLLPWIRDRYHASRRAADIVLAGASRRGLVAAHVAMLRPEAVGNVLALSGAFYWRPTAAGRFEWLSAEYARRPPVPVRFFLSVGTLETVITESNGGHYPLATNRHFADVLHARGYAYTLQEFAGTHDELNWRAWFGRGLLELLPREPGR